MNASTTLDDPSDSTRRSCPSSPTTTLGPMRRVPCRQRQPAEHRLDQRRLARSVGADERDAVRPPDVERERPQREVAALDHRVVQPRHHGPRPGRLVDAKRRSHPSHGFSTVSSVSRARSVRRARDASFSVLLMRKSRCALSLSRGFFFSLVTPVVAHWRSRSGPLGQLRLLRLVHRVRLFRVGALGGPLGEIPGPSAAVQPPAPGVLVELEHVGDRPVQEGAVVRHDDHAASSPRHQLLQPRQPVEVEIVRRLVQQRDVEARQQDRRQRHPRLLAARQRIGAVVRHGGRQAHLLEHAGQPRLEVGGPERLVARQRRGVPLVRPLWPSPRAPAASVNSVSAAAAPVLLDSAARTVSPRASPSACSRSCSWRR